ncbi:MAG: MFS transporter, partial [Treponemataceae bacterium]
MGLCLTNNFSWNRGYQVIAGIQVLLVAILFFSLPLWKIKKTTTEDNTQKAKEITLKEAMHLPGARPILLAFFSYCALESSTGFWASTYMVLYRNIEPQVAASWTAFFYIGITAGRFLSGFVSDNVGNRNMIRSGLFFICVGVFLILIPQNIFLLAGLVILGIGCAPIYPAIIHATPENFGADNSQALIGIQMASAYTGATFMPPLFGFLSGVIGLSIYPFYLAFFCILMIIMTEKVNYLHKKR